ncbi:MAG: protein phosphatase CheZ [candidate division Zixibacteria bacterium]|nr:protein phosphatase CheZ [candidate division Zixibacteria bacterium]
MAISEKLYGKMQSEVIALASSINEVVGKFKELHSPLTESREKVPKATEQLDKISEQTEVAASQMLDKVEGITQREDDVIQGLNGIKEKVASGNLTEIVPMIDTLIEKANTTSEDAYIIMDALQFQDITTQQMNHAASLLEDIEERLHSIVGVIQGSKETNDSYSEPNSQRKERAYDPHADYSDKKTTQSDIDSLFAGEK